MEKENFFIFSPIEVLERQNSTVASSDSIPDEYKQLDLMFIKSVLASTGMNDNDDVFLKDELWKAASSATYKPIDWEHDRTKVIGVMLKSYNTDKNGTTISTMPETDFDVVDEGVIWKYFDEEKANKIKEGAKKHSLFVSMECYFTDYDYLVGNKVVKRNEMTSFLDASLRAKGGTGLYNGQKTGRVLRNIIFGGKGIVENPANKDSKIKAVASVSTQIVNASPEYDKIILDNVIACYKEENSMASENIEAALPKKKEGGHDSAPKGYPTDKSKYADPSNWLYPLDTDKYVRAAIVYFIRYWKKQYTEDEAKSVWARIKSAAKKFKIDVTADPFSSKASAEMDDATYTALSTEYSVQTPAWSGDKGWHSVISGKSLDGENDNTNSHSEEVETKMDELKKENEALLAKIKELETQVSAGKTKELEEKLAKATESIATLTKSNEELGKKVSEHEGTISNKDKALAEMTKELEKVKGEFTKANESLKAIETEKKKVARSAALKVAFPTITEAKLTETVEKHINASDEDFNKIVEDHKSFASFVAPVVPTAPKTPEPTKPTEPEKPADTTASGLNVPPTKPDSVIPSGTEGEANIKDCFKAIVEKLKFPKKEVKK